MLIRLKLGRSKSAFWILGLSLLILGALLAFYSNQAAMFATKVLGALMLLSGVSKAFSHEKRGFIEYKWLIDLALGGWLLFAESSHELFGYILGLWLLLSALMNWYFRFKSTREWFSTKDLVSVALRLVFGLLLFMFPSLLSGGLMFMLGILFMASGLVVLNRIRYIE